MMLRRRRAASAASPPWADLPPEVLLNIAGRLHVASDLVRLYAVCSNWKIALVGDPPSHWLLPWLLAPSSSSAAGDKAEEQRCLCVFSKATYRAPGICVGDRRVAYDDGTAAWLVRNKDEISLANPLTAERLALLAGRRLSDWWLNWQHRIVYGDDSCVLLYNFHPQHGFQASFLHPGLGNKWFYLSSRLSNSDRCCAAACHLGGYVVCVDLAYCHVLRPRQELVNKYNYYNRTREVRAALPEVPAGKVRRCSYLMEFDGVLLLASVLQQTGGGDGLSVSLHELRLDADRNGGEEPEVEWVRRDRSSSDMSLLEEEVLFLGSPNSFTIEAAEFGGEVTGGTAYFVMEAGGQRRSSGSPAAEPTCGVYRYRFCDGTATLVERLPAGWHDANCMWFLPDPQFEEDSEPATQEGFNTAMTAPNAVGAPAEDHSLTSEFFALLLVILLISALVWIALGGFSFLRNFARILI